MNTQAHQAIVISEARAWSDQDRALLRTVELDRPRRHRRWFRAAR